MGMVSQYVRITASRNVWIAWKRRHEEVVEVGKPMLMIALLALLNPSPTPAQLIPIGAGEVSRVDAYGNARPWYPERRSVGMFQNAMQRRGARGFQNTGRRVNQRGGFSGFAVPGDLFSRLRRARFSRLLPGTTFSPVASSRRRLDSFSALPADVGSVFSRRMELLSQANTDSSPESALGHEIGRVSLAPRTRAASFRRLFRSIPASWESPSAGSLEGREPASSLRSPAVPATMGALLEASLQSRQAQLRDEGWQEFRAGRYRRAHRVFERAMLLDPEDLSAQVGEIFAQASNGSMRSAITALRILVRRRPAPFVSSWSVAERYGGPREASRVRLQCELYVQQSDHAPDTTALYAFVLWYLGDRDTAVQVAASLERENPKAVLAGWRSRMEALRKDSAPGEALH